MRLKYYLFLIGIVFFFDCFGQRSMSKSEIFSEWNRKTIQNKDEFNNSNNPFLDSSRNELLIRIGKLQTSYEVFGFFVISNFEAISVDSCEIGTSPFIAYVFWQNSSKETFIQKITNRCTFPERRTNNLYFLDFFEKYKSEIDKEYIMPVILSAENDNGRIKYKMIEFNHDIIYSIYCKTGNYDKFFHFSENDLSNKQSLFYEDNLASKTYKWFYYIKNNVTEF